MNRIYLGSLAIASFVVAGCLPGDTRPVPARLAVEAEASEQSVNGFTTYDGWAIHFDQLLVGMGNILIGRNPELGDCRVYENADYIRLFDFTLPGRQKLGEVYGLGECAIFLGLRSPSADSLLQNGVTTNDRDFMRGASMDEGPMQLVTDAPAPSTAIYMRGTAKRASKIKQFAWRFVARDVLGYCGDYSHWTTQMQLNGNDDLRSVVSFHGENLFGATGNSFDGFANADLDQDDEITEVEIDNQFNFNPPADEIDTREFGLGGSYWQTWLASMVSFDGRTCTHVEYDAMWGGGDGPF